MVSKYKLCPCNTSLLLASNNICFQKSGDILNKNTLGVKKVRGKLETALQTGATKNFDISEAKKLLIKNLFNYGTAQR